MRIACFATNTPDRPIAELELRHRLRARAEDRIRASRATGLRNLPLHTTAQNKVWLQIVQIALDLLARIPRLTLTGKSRLREPRRLRLRLFTAAGQLVTTGRRRPSAWPGTGPGPATSPPHSDGSHSCRMPADQRIHSSLRQPFTTRSSGTHPVPFDDDVDIAPELLAHAVPHPARVDDGALRRPDGGPCKRHGDRARTSAEVGVAGQVAPGRQAERRRRVGGDGMDDGTGGCVTDLLAQAEQESDAQQAGAVDGQVGCGKRRRRVIGCPSPALSRGPGPTADPGPGR